MTATRIRLANLAHARSGDKGNTANIGLVAYRPRDYELLRREVTAERAGKHLEPFGVGEVRRFELPGLCALNFLVRDALDGGGTLSLRNDSQGKVLSNALLRMEVEVPAQVAEECADQGFAPEGWSPADTRSPAG